MPKKRIHINIWWLILTSLLLFLCSLLVFFRLLENTVGGPITFDMKWTMSETPDLRIALLDNGYEKNIFVQQERIATAEAYQKNLLEMWHYTLKSYGFSTHVVQDEAIEKGRLLNKQSMPEYDMLILPASRALSEKERKQIQLFMQEGGNVLASWAVGTYTSKGTWDSWNFIEETFGATFTNFVSHTSESYKIVRQDTLQTNLKSGVYAAKEGNAQTFSGSFLQQISSNYTWGTDAQTCQETDCIIVDSLDSNIRKVTYTSFEGEKPVLKVRHPENPIGTKTFTLRGNTPITAGIPPGYRLRVGTYDAPIQMQVKGRNTQAVGHWHDYIYEDAPINEGLQQSAGILYGTYGKGRFVYLGFDLSALHTAESKDLGLTGADEIVLQKLFENIFYWLGEQPVSWLSNWPYGYQAAAFLAGIVDNEGARLQETAHVIQSEGASATFFLPHVLPDFSQDALKQLHLSHELALYNGGNLKGEKSKLEQQINQSIFGYLSPQGQLKKSQNETLEKLGFTYIVTDSIATAEQAKVMDKPFEKLVLVNRVGKTFKHITSDGHLDPTGIATILTQDIMRVQYNKGLYPLIFNLSAMEQEANLGGVGSIVHYLRENQFWLATGSELASWTQQRSKLAVSAKKYSPERMVVSVSNDNGATVDSVGLYVHLDRPFNVATEEILIRPEDAKEIFTRDVFELERNKDYHFINEELILLKITHLRPNEYRTYQIDIKPRNLSEKPFWERFFRIAMTR